MTPAIYGAAGALVVGLAAGGAGAWFWQANSYGTKIADNDKRQARVDAKAAVRAKEETEKYRVLERAAADALLGQAWALQEERTRVKTERTARDVAIRAGNLRLSIAVRSCEAGPGGAAADATIAGGDRPEARAELAPEAAVALEGIADDGDDAIRAHAACVDAYGAVRATLNGGSATGKP